MGGIIDLNGNAIGNTSKNQRQIDVEKTKQQMNDSLEGWLKTVNAYIIPGNEQNLSEYYPLHNMVLLAPHVVREQTDSGVLFSPAEVQAQKDIVNSGIAYKVVKVGPEVVNCKVGDYVIKGSPQPGYPIPMIDDREDGDGKVHSYACYAENWIVGVFRSDSDASEFVKSPHPLHELLSSK